MQNTAWVEGTITCIFLETMFVFVCVCVCVCAHMQSISEIYKKLARMVAHVGI